MQRISMLVMSTQIGLLMLTTVYEHLRRRNDDRKLHRFTADVFDNLRCYSGIVYSRRMDTVIVNGESVRLSFYDGCNTP